MGLVLDADCRVHGIENLRVADASAMPKAPSGNTYLGCVMVAERVARFVDIVGAERVIAGSDCGFGTFAGYGAVDPDIAYAKLAALAEGARRAS